MKTLQVLALAALCSIFTSCHHTADTTESAKTEKVYNVAVILDGTDRLQNSNAISLISTAELTDLARKIAENGTGSLFVSYVDRDCSNNYFALFEMNQQKPQAPGKKKEYIMQSTYDKEVQEYQMAEIEYQKIVTDALEAFSDNCERVTKAAYSDQTASEKQGSDVFGAVNKALKAIAANESAQFSHIVLVSDCVHNAPTEKLAEIPPSVELIAVNTSEGGSLEGLISKQLITFSQLINYLFNL